MNSPMFKIIFFVATAVIFLSTVYAQISGKTKIDTIKASPEASSTINTFGNETKKADEVSTTDLSMKKTGMKDNGKIGDITAASVDSGYWTCTMHPAIRKTEGGNCPICGMKLVFRKSDKDTVNMMSAHRTNVKK